MFAKNVVNNLRVGFRELATNGRLNLFAGICFVTVWPYIFIGFWRKITRKDRVRATWVAVAGVACDIAIGAGFRFDIYLLAVAASVAYAVLTFYAASVRVD